jgi:hypothetical protein
MTIHQTTTDPIVQCIFQEYLEETRSTTTSSSCEANHHQEEEEEDEEDIVLAALAVLEADDRDARGLWKAEQEQQQQIHGAAVAGGLAGLVLGGPILGVVAAGGVALAAARNLGTAGDLARASGEAVVNAREHMKSMVDQNNFVRSLDWSRRRRTTEA